MTKKYSKTDAIIAYLWWIGFLFAYFRNQNKRNPLTSFHIRQALGLLLINTGASVVYKYIGETFGSLLILATIVLWFIGINAAIRGVAKPIPLVGTSFQQWFKNLY